MDLNSLDKIDYANTIFEGIRKLSIILQNPNIREIPSQILTVMDVSIDKAVSLYVEAIAEDANMGT